MAADQVVGLGGRHILLTGATGMVGAPLARVLARDNIVYGGARFSNGAAHGALAEAGVTPVRVDLGAADFAEVPADVDVVLNFAVARSNDWSADFATNVDGVALLMEHCVTRCDRLEAFLHCSTAGVYQSQGQVLLTESAPLGDSHRAAGFETYSLSKIAVEPLVRHTAARLGLPTVIARLSVPYGDTFGWPCFQLLMIERGIPLNVHPDAPSRYSPLHLDDIAASLPVLLGAASVPATVVNWGGDETVALEEWCGYLGELVGAEPVFTVDPNAIPPLPLDLSRLHALGFHSTVDWRDGMRRLVAASRGATAQ
ncbi:MAG TPA: NAD(P)-dependent oxidoreductase [Acidimicrobiia bacterium]